MSELKGMTIKQIAELCGVAESTVRSWIKQTADSEGLTAKTAVSQGKEAARFTLEETLTIIRAGGHETLADLLQENAERLAQSEERGIVNVNKLLALFTEFDSKQLVQSVQGVARFDRLIFLLTQLVLQGAKASGQNVEMITMLAELRLLSFEQRDPCLCSIQTYGKMRKMSTAGGTGISYGIKASAICKDRKLKTVKVLEHIEDYGFKEVKCYPISILGEVFGA